MSLQPPLYHSPAPALPLKLDLALWKHNLRETHVRLFPYTCIFIYMYFYFNKRYLIDKHFLFACFHSQYLYTQINVSCNLVTACLSNSFFFFILYTIRSPRQFVIRPCRNNPKFAICVCMRLLLNYTMRNLFNQNTLINIICWGFI